MSLTHRRAPQAVTASILFGSCNGGAEETPAIFGANVPTVRCLFYHVLPLGDIKGRCVNQEVSTSKGEHDGLGTDGMPVPQKRSAGAIAAGFPGAPSMTY